MLVSQDQPFVESYLRYGQSWNYHVFRGLKAILKAEDLGVEIPLQAIYACVEFPPEEPVSEERETQVR